MATAALFGSTGAVGSQILATLLSTDAFSAVKTVSRRLPSSTSPKLEAIEEADTAKWGGLISTLAPKPNVVFNAVGTTRAAAGGLAQQWKIDHDLCIENAKAAKAAGVKTYVFISSAGTRGLLAGYAPYSKMKVGVEDAIKELDFEHAIILRPGMILNRSSPKAPLFEKIVENLHKVGQGIQDTLGTSSPASPRAQTSMLMTMICVGQDQTFIGRAAVVAARKVEEGQAPSKFWVVEAADILKFGRDEWKE